MKYIGDQIRAIDKSPAGETKEKKKKKKKKKKVYFFDLLF
jgi:hypothetical protein